jgi:hypothetical protein
VRVASLVALLLTLAGCSSSPEAPTDPPEPILAASDLGTLFGIVVDSTITPMQGVDLVIRGMERNTTTSSDGAFRFVDLPAGSYVVLASKFNFVTVESRTDVVEGAAPDELRIVLNQRAGTEPLLSPIQFDGHMTCGLRLPEGTFASGCVVGGFVGDFGGHQTYLDIESGNVTWVQTEIVWTPQSQTADSLCLRIAVYGLADQCGPSGILMAIDEAASEAGGIGMGTKPQLVMYADYLVQGTVGIAFEQPFQAFTHVFYNWVPENGWVFSADGEPTP